MSLRIRQILCAVSWVSVIQFSAGPAQAAAPITPSGLNTEVNLSAASPTGTVQYDITGGTRAGTNLFHSFGDFNVPNNNIANFVSDSALTTSNILARVTGANVSNIYGTIQTTGFGNANLFLMNPAGIVFGPNASLNVGGSVAFTTGDYLQLKDGVLFNALPNAATDSLLSTAPVAAYGFLGTNSGAIAVQGSQLKVPQEREISLVGGNITIQSGTLENGNAQPTRFSAPNGQINLATTKSPGEFPASFTTEQTDPSSPNVNGASFRSFGSVHLTSGSTVDVSQTRNGRLSIRSGQLILEIQDTILDTADNKTLTTAEPGIDKIILAQKSSVLSHTSSSDWGPDVTIKADRIVIQGIPGTALDFGSLPFTGITANTEGVGNAGNIRLQANKNIETMNVVNLNSLSGSNLDGTKPSPALAQGHAGNVELISMDGNIQMMHGGRLAQVASVTSRSSGDTGRVRVEALKGNIVLDGTNLFTQSEGGSVGPVEVAAQNLHMKAGFLGNEIGLLSNTNSGSVRAGGITVMLSGTLTMEADFSAPAPIPPYSLIVTSAFSPNSTPAGDIKLTAKDITATQGSLISSETFGAGPGGQLKIFTNSLHLTEGSQIKNGSAFAPPFGRLPRGVTPSGPGGDINIQGLDSKGSIVIDGQGSGILANTEGTGTGGTINLSARNITIQNGGAVSASTTGSDPRAIGGSIILNATEQVTLTNGASITASSISNPKIPNTGVANAGNININAGRQLELHNDSSIATTTISKQANGGDINIQAIDSVRLVNSEISTSVKGAEGSGGNIFIDPKVVILQDSDVTARAVGGAGGNITFVTPLFLKDSASLVDATSQRGPSGTVSIQSPLANLSSTVGQLVSKTSPPQVLLQNRCVALAGGEQSTFIVAGRDRMPSEPGGWLSSPVSMEHLIGNGMEHAVGITARTIGLHESPTMIARASETEVLSLRRLTPPGFLVGTFAIGPTGCHS